MGEGGLSIVKFSIFITSNPFLLSRISSALKTSKSFYLAKIKAFFISSYYVQDVATL